MKLACPNCKTVFSLPDDRIPPGKGVKILCPRCHEPCSEAEAKREPEFNSGKNFEDDPQRGSNLAYQEAGSTFLEQGTKRALICVSDETLSKEAGDLVQHLRFYVDAVPAGKEAVAKLNQHRYELVMLEEVFNGMVLAENPVFLHLRAMPMHFRRDTFLCLLSNRLRTMERMAGFRLGVNAIINVRDMNRAEHILRQVLREHELLYAAYIEGLERKGRL